MLGCLPGRGYRYWTIAQAWRDARHGFSDFRPAGRYAAGVSKVDAQRAMREARYATIQASGPPRAAAARAAAPPTGSEPGSDSGSEFAVAPPTQRGRKKAAPAAAEPPTEVGRAAEASEAGERLCGHRSIGNKSCQREAGHAEKAHRYK